MPPTARKFALLLPDMGGGGAERVALRLAQDWVAAGHRVDLLLLRAEGRLLELLPPEVRVIDLGAGRILGAILPLARYLRRSRPDAVQASMWPLTIAAIIGGRLARTRARIVVSEHIALSKQYGGGGALGSAFLTKSIAWFYPLADARVAVSESAADDLARLSGISRASVDVIYNPVPQPAPEPSHLPDIEALWGSGGARILTVGRLGAQKNQALLIRAFARVRRTRAARLMILGEGPLRAELEQVAAAQGVAGDVVFPGFALDPWPFYASADLFVLSSDYEGFGLVLVEAMQCGLPVVSTDCESGPREILDHGRYGALVACGDEEGLANAMSAALDRPADKDRLKARAAELSGAAASDRYLELMIGPAAVRSLR